MTSSQETVQRGRVIAARVEAIGLGVGQQRDRLPRLHAGPRAIEPQRFLGRMDGAGCPHQGRSQARRETTMPTREPSSACAVIEQCRRLDSEPESSDLAQARILQPMFDLGQGQGREVGRMRKQHLLGDGGAQLRLEFTQERA